MNVGPPHVILMLVYYKILLTCHLVRAQKPWSNVRNPMSNQPNIGLRLRFECRTGPTLGFVSLSLIIKQSSLVGLGLKSQQKLGFAGLDMKSLT